jgi:hypothetical protein
MLIRDDVKKTCKNEEPLTSIKQNSRRSAHIPEVLAEILQPVYHHHQ